MKSNTETNTKKLKSQGYDKAHIKNNNRYKKKINKRKQELTKKFYI